MGTKKKGFFQLRNRALVTVVLVALTACGGDDGASDDGGTGATGTSGATGSAAEGCAGNEVESIALLLPGKADDQGYSQLGASALDAAAEEHGISETSIAESVDVAQQVEVYRDFATQGFDLIVGWGGQYEDGAVEVAGQFPEVCFADFNGVGGNGTNYSSFDLAGEQWTFIVGYVMGRLTKTGTVGIVAGPCFDSSARQAHGVRDGVLMANPDAEVIISGVDSFDDPAAAKEAAAAQIQQGADAIEVNLNTGNLGVFQAAQDAGDVLVTTEFFDQSDAAPDVILTSSVRDASVAINLLVNQIEQGDFGDPVRITLTAEEQALAPFRDLAPESLFEEAKGVQAQIANGEIEVAADGSCPYKG